MLIKESSTSIFLLFFGVTVIISLFPRISKLLFHHLQTFSLELFSFIILFLLLGNKSLGDRNRISNGFLEDLWFSSFSILLFCILLFFLQDFFDFFFTFFFLFLYFMEYILLFVIFILFLNPNTLLILLFWKWLMLMYLSLMSFLLEIITLLLLLFIYLEVIGLQVNYFWFSPS